MPCFSNRRIEPAAALSNQAKQGDHAAQYELGLCYLNGVNVTKSDKNARYWLKKAADGGHLQAQERLGYCYENGIGGKCNQAKGVQLTRQASDNGDPTAQFRYARYLGSTCGKVRDEGTMYSRRRRDQCYVDDRILNERRGRYTLFISAAEKGSADAQLKVARDAMLSAKLPLGTRDVGTLQQAIIFARQAFAQGRTEAQELVDEFIKRLKYSGNLASVPRPPSPLPGEVEYKNAEPLYLKEQFNAALPGLEAAAQAGYPPAFVLLHQLYSNDDKLRESNLAAASQYKSLIIKSKGWYEQYDAYNESVAQFCLGWCKFYGIGQDESQWTAQKHFEDATFNRTSGQCPIAYNWLALCVEKIDYLKDKSIVFKAYECSANNGSPTGEYNVGRCYEYGIGITKDIHKANHWYSRAASKGKQEASERLTAIQSELQQGSAQFSSQQLGAQAGDAAMQNTLGESYEKGFGIEKDDVRAVEWYKRAATQGDSNGAYNLARCNELGIGVTKSYQEARKWYHIAATKNHALAIKKLTTLKSDFENQQKQHIHQQLLEAEKFWRFCTSSYDKNSPKKHADRQRALELCRPLAEAGNPEAQLRYGKYLAGDTFINNSEKNKAAAFEWYLKAYNQNYKPAFDKAGACYMLGSGVKRDYAQAEKCFLREVTASNFRPYIKIADMYYDAAIFSIDLPRKERVGLYQKAIQYLTRAEHEGLRSDYRSSSQIIAKLEAQKREWSERDTENLKEKAERFRVRAWHEVTSMSDYSRNVNYNKKIEESLSPEDKILFRSVVFQKSKAESIRLKQEHEETQQRDKKLMAIKEADRRASLRADILAAEQERSEKSDRRWERNQMQTESNNLKDWGRNRADHDRAAHLDRQLNSNK